MMLALPTNLALSHAGRASRHLGSDQGQPSSAAVDTTPAGLGVPLVPVVVAVSQLVWQLVVIVCHSWTAA